MRLTLRKLGVIVAALVSVTGAAAGVVVVSQSVGASNPSVVLGLSETSSWNRGAVFSWQITNKASTPVDGWKLAFSLPSGEAVTNLWNGSYTTNGTRTIVTNDSWDASIAPGQSAGIGFQVSSPGKAKDPTGCSFNGVALSCGGTTTTTTTTTTSSSTTTTTTTVPSSTTTTTIPTGSGTIPAHYFAPYADMTEYPQFGLAATAQATGQKYFTLAFIVEGSSACQPSWGGYYPVSQTPPYALADIQNLRKQRGDVIISFGGEANTELALSCTNVSQLEAAYQQVIDTYGVTHIDFDIEGAAEADQASITRRDEAIAALQTAAAAAGKALDVSFTLPVLPSGLTADGLAVLKDAAAHGVTLSKVNVMAMDYGDANAPDPAGKMGTYAEDAATSTEAQLASLYPSKTAAKLWSMVGVTPMIGVNDQADEVFQPSDAQQLLTFAEQKGMGELSMWSSTRDLECPGGAEPYSEPTCSSIVQSPNAFTDSFEPFSH